MLTELGDMVMNHVKADPDSERGNSRTRSSSCSAALCQESANVFHRGGVVVAGELGKIGHPEVVRIWYPIKVLRVWFPVPDTALRLHAVVLPHDGRDLLIQSELLGENLISQ